MNIKDYDKWNILKKTLNNKKIDIKYPRIREIWWTNIGLNIGSEIYGKGLEFSRPVLVIKVNKGNFIGLPLSSKIRKDDSRFTIKTLDGKYHSVLLNQIKVFDNKRLANKKYVLPNNLFNKIILKLKNTIITDD